MGALRLIRALRVRAVFPLDSTPTASPAPWRIGRIHTAQTSRRTIPSRADFIVRRRDTRSQRHEENKTQRNHDGEFCHDSHTAPHANGYEILTTRYNHKPPVPV